MSGYVDHAWRHAPRSKGGTDPIKPKAQFDIKLFMDDEIVTTSPAFSIFAIPADLDGTQLTAVEIYVTTVSSSGLPTMQITNATAAVDMLSTEVTIDVGDKNSKDATAAAVIDTANATVSHGDEILMDVTVAGTGAKGLGVILDFG